MKNLAIFASGNGTNAENIITYFNTTASGQKKATVKVVISNKANAYVLERAKLHGVEGIVIEKEELTSETPKTLLQILEQYDIHYIILAGYLLKIPALLTEQYKGKIINIHPALLPKFGGKGMYGIHVHKAVIEAGENMSGITIHLVDAVYDNGTILFQAKCPVSPNDTPDSLAAKVQSLEQKHFPQIIEQYIADI